MNSFMEDSRSRIGHTDSWKWRQGKREEELSTQVPLAGVGVGAGAGGKASRVKTGGTALGLSSLPIPATLCSTADTRSLPYASTRGYVISTSSAAGPAMVHGAGRCAPRLAAVQRLSKSAG